MKISIALCTYNGAKFLAEQLESILRQTRLPDELIVCDDKSNDQTVKIINEFSRKAPFPVRVFVNEKTLRTVKNFEKSISLCSGDIIALSDQDDVWHREKLEIFEAIFEAQPEVGLVFSNANLVDENLVKLNVTNWDGLNFTAQKLSRFKTGASLDYLLKGAYVWGCMMAFRARYKELVLPIPENLTDIIHDSWIAWLVAAASIVEPVSTCLVDYRQHPGQQLGQKSVEKSSFGDNIKRSNNYDDEVIRLTALRERLLINTDRFPVQKALIKVNSRLLHFKQRREMLSSSTGKKLWLIGNELIGLRYHTETSGFKSALKDLFLK